MPWIRDIRVESVARLNPSPPRALDAARTVADAVALMRAENVGCLLVTAGGKLAGIFTERDLLTRVLAKGKPLALALANVMTHGPVSVAANDPIRTAVVRMNSGGYRHLPVVDEADHPVGILSARHIVRYLAEHYPNTVFTQPPDPHAYPDSRYGA